jgi:hypothetical protein
MKAFVTVLLCVMAMVACSALVPPASPPPPASSPQPVAPPPQSAPPAPAPPSSPPIAPPSPAPSASAAFTVNCLGSSEPGGLASSPTVLHECSELVSAVLAAVAPLGYPVQAMTLRTFDFGCGGPFAMGVYFCPMIPAARKVPGSGYVTFIGTDKVAAVSYEAVDDPPIIVKVVAFQVPPAGWVMP